MKIPLLLIVVHKNKRHPLCMKAGAWAQLPTPALPGSGFRVLCKRQISAFRRPCFHVRTQYSPSCGQKSSPGLHIGPGLRIDSGKENGAGGTAYERRSRAACGASGRIHCGPWGHGTGSGAGLWVQQIHRPQGRFHPAAVRQPGAVCTGAGGSGPEQGRAPPAGRCGHPEKVSTPIIKNKRRAEAPKKALHAAFDVRFVTARCGTAPAPPFPDG